MQQYDQIVTLVAALNHVMEEIPPNHIKSFQSEMLQYIDEQAPHINRELQQTEVLSEKLKQDIVVLAREYLGKVQGT